MKEQMIERINKEIKEAKAVYDSIQNEPYVIKAEKMNAYYRTIDGMIEMLAIATCKEYTYDENGVKEK